MSAGDVRSNPEQRSITRSETSGFGVWGRGGCKVGVMWWRWGSGVEVKRLTGGECYRYGGWLGFGYIGYTRGCTYTHVHTCTHMVHT